MVIRRWLGVLILCLLLRPTAAQTQAVLSLKTTTTTLQTGQTYDVVIQLDGVADLWLTSAEIGYDPALVYVMGTKAGSPVQPGTLFAPTTATVVVQNRVQTGKIQYITSMLAPANPVSGSGTVGIFRIYPLAPGTVRLSFSQAELTKVTFVGEGENQQGTNPQAIPFTPVYLELTITGDPVEPPSEATATPAPTDTPAAQIGAARPTDEPTLVNVPAAPADNVTSTPEIAAAPAENTSVLLLAVGLMVIAVIGLVVLWIVWRRRR